jgi:hypothetical protein
MSSVVLAIAGLILIAGAVAARENTGMFGGQMQGATIHHDASGERGGTESPEPSESPEPTQPPEASPSPEPTETPESNDSEDQDAQGDQNDQGNQDQGNSNDD